MAKLVSGTRFSYSYDPISDLLVVSLLGPRKALKDGETVEIHIPGIREFIDHATELIKERDS